MGRPPRTRTRIEAQRQVRELSHALGREIRRIRDDAGISQARLAGEAGISQAHLSAIEAGRPGASVSALAAIAVALGGRLGCRLDTGTGPAIRDRYQARMVEALLRELHPRWKRFLEVPVHRPMRGVIDIVLHDTERGVIVAGEAQSQLRRLEQTIRWSNEKANALLPSHVLPLAPDYTTPPTVSRLLLLRSTQATREIARVFEKTLQTAYPEPAAALRAALTRPNEPWPGAGIVWVAVDGRHARLMEGPPRGVTLGR